MRIYKTLSVVAIFAICLSYLTLQGRAQDSLRIIELSGPGQSAPVSIPAGHAFTFSLFTPESGKNDYDAAVGVVTYAAPISFTYERKFQETVQEGWLLGPALVALRGNGAGARMQLYTMKLPAGVVSGILSGSSPTRSVAIPKGSILSSYLEFVTSTTRHYNDWNTLRTQPFTHLVSVLAPKGLVYGYSDLPHSSIGNLRIGSPRIRGLAGLHNPNAPASSVVNQFYYDDLDSVSPTADFVGPGTATFSLPPEGERSTPIAFYCYRITPANVIGADATPPVVKVTTPTAASATTTLSSYVLKGEVTDNINPTSIRFRTQPPNRTTDGPYGAWASVTLSGDLKTKGWQQSVSLTSKGIWRIQIQALDGEQNASAVQTVTLTRQ